MRDLENLFSVTPEDIRRILRDFHSEMQKGLAGSDSSLKMIPSFVDRPTGTETGRFIALDLGGTHFRVLIVELDGKGHPAVVASGLSVVEKAYMEGTADGLFDFLAARIDDLFAENGIDRSAHFDVAFTFSFPVDQTGVASGRLIQWTKGFTTRGVMGKDVVKLLTEALARKGLTGLRVAALANDTVGTLVEKSYTDKDCDIGVVLGTGTNACYVEKLSNISKWKGGSSTGRMIVNMEWGNFNRLKRNRYDIDLDHESPNPGHQYLEKMVSGMYLGEISRRVIRDLMESDFLFRGADGKNRFAGKGSFETERMSLIQSDGSKDLTTVEQFLRDLGIHRSTLCDRQWLKKVCDLVSTRAATVSAAAIAAVITWMDPDLASQHTVAVDGALFEKYPGFGDKMKAVLVDLLHENASQIKMELSKDGSGKGAAIIAAVAASAKPKR